MPYCSSCGSPIPEGQGKSCSMCYGDMYHGSDGYYQKWAEEQMRREEEERSVFDDDSWVDDPESELGDKG